MISTSDDRRHWPRRVEITTASKAPPFVDEPTFLRSDHQQKATLKLRAAAEEYGPISNYFLVVVWANSTLSTSELMTSQLVSYGKEIPPKHDPALGYIAANLSKNELNSMILQGGRQPGKKKRRRRRKRGAEDKLGAEFTLGNEQMYGGYKNWPLLADHSYKVFVRAFAERYDPKTSDRVPADKGRPPKLDRDSQYSSPFRVKAADKPHKAPKSHFWLAGPIAAILVVTLIICLLFVCWMRRNKSVFSSLNLILSIVLFSE